jgi:hypothetical protein
MADLTTLENVKQDMSIGETADDAKLSRLITEFSVWFLNEINRGALLEDAYNEKRNGYGGDSIVTKYYPITAVSSVIVSGVNIPASPDGVATGFVFDDLTIYLTGCYRFIRGRQNIQLNYTAGFATVPADVERAVINQVIFTFRQLQKLGTVSQQMQGVTTAQFSQKDLAPGVGTVIENYRCRALVGL